MAKVNKAVRRKTPYIFVVTRPRLEDFQDWLKRACGDGVDLSLIVECSPGGSGNPTHYALEMDLIEELPGDSKMLRALQWAKSKIPGNAVTEHPAKDNAGKKMDFDAVMVRDGKNLKKHKNP